MRRWLAALLGAIAWNRATAAQATTGWTTVAYISGATIYLDAGTRAGLREGSRAEVVRGGVPIAQLLVDYVSSTRAACTVASSSTEPVVGDSVRFVAAPSAAEPVQPAGDSGRARRAARRDAVRGRVGLRYVMVDPGGGRPGWTQPALDLRLDGHGVGGSPLGVVLDVRAYRQRSGATGRGAAATTRVYQGNLEWQPSGGPLRVGAGRQLSPSLSTLGIFDGVSVEVAGSRVNAGAVAGTQPDAITFGPSGLVREYAGYLQVHSAPAATTPWALTLGGIGSYDQGNIDREYAYVQLTSTTRFVSVYATQEMDINRGWKAAAEGQSTTPTSTFAMVRLAPIDAISLNLGYDNRRSVRLYRDFVDPEIAFDDAFRQGGWVGLSLSAGSHVRVSTDARQSRGGGATDATSWTGIIDVLRLTPLRLGLQLRGSEYQGSAAEGRLTSATVQLDPWDRLHLSVGGGRRTDTRLLTDVPARPLDWREYSGDVAIGRSIFLMLSWYDERGDAGRSRQGYAALSWRF